MSCIRCGDDTEESAYLCEVCAETCYQDPLFLFSPGLMGESLVERLRSQAAALVRLGPVSGGDVERVQGQSFLDKISTFKVDKASEEESKKFLEATNFIMCQYGLPVYGDTPQLSLTEDAAKIVALIAQKVNAIISGRPNVVMSDVFLRMGFLYWSASRSVLHRAGPVAWCREKRRQALTRALEYLSKIDRKDDLFSLASKMSGLILLDAGAYADAEQKLSNARKSFPYDMAIIRALAKTHFHMGNIDEALSLTDQMLSTNASPEVLFEKGEYLRKSGRYDEAIATYEQAINIDRKFVRAYKALIFLLRGMKRTDDVARWEADLRLAVEPGAVAQLEELIDGKRLIIPEIAAIRARREPLIPSTRPKVRREEVKDLLKAAKEAVNTGDFDRAIELLKIHLAEKGKDLGTLILLCRAYLYNGQFEEAKKAVEELLRREGMSAAGWYWKAKIAYAEGRWGAAIQHLNRATNLLPTFVDAWVERGLVFLANEKHEDAAESFEVALEIDKNDARAWLGRAKAMSRLERWGAAIQCLDHFLELMPESREGWLIKADLLLEKSKYQEAEKAFKKYLDMEPGDSRAWCDRGIALHSMGLTDDAVMSFKRCLEIDPNNNQALNWLKTIARGDGGG